ncbi:hypothetical protein VTI28DRAFT_8079 [Corynascus sepedonium]
MYFECTAVLPVNSPGRAVQNEAEPPIAMWRASDSPNGNQRARCRAEIRSGPWTTLGFLGRGCNLIPALSNSDDDRMTMAR